MDKTSPKLKGAIAVSNGVERIAMSYSGRYQNI